MGGDTSTTATKVIGAIAGLIIPLVGLILFLVWRKTKPAAAKCAGIGAIIGFVLNVILMATGVA